MRHIYIVGFVDGKRDKLKIGLAKDPIARLMQLQTGSDRRIMLYRASLVRKAESVEKAIHTLLAEHRLNGEWFNIPEDKLYALVDILDALDMDCDCKACLGIMKPIKGAK